MSYIPNMDGQASGEAKPRTSVSGYWLFLYPLTVIATIAGTAVAWDYVPNPVPIHYGPAMTADGFVDKQVTSLIPIFILQAVFCAIFIGCHFLVKHAPKEIISFPFGEIKPAIEPQVRYVTSRYTLITGIVASLYIGILEIVVFTANLNWTVSLSMLAIIMAFVVISLIMLRKMYKKLVDSIDKTTRIIKPDTPKVN